MLVKVTATVETMVEVKDNLDLVDACEQARDCVRASCFEILREDLGNSFEDQIPLAATVVQDKNDLPGGWSHCVPWHSDGDDDDKNDQTCDQLLKGKKCR